MELILWMFSFLSEFQATSPTNPYLSLLTFCSSIWIQSYLGLIVYNVSIVFYWFYLSVSVEVLYSCFIYICGKQSKWVTASYYSSFVALWVITFLLCFKPILCLLNSFRFQVFCVFRFLYPFRHSQLTTLNLRQFLKRFVAL